MAKTYIYGRVSTTKQDTENQLTKAVELYPTASVVREVCSSGRKRPKLTHLLNDVLESGDTLIVPALDRLARSLKEALHIIDLLSRKKVNLVSIRESIDMSTAVGRLVVHVLLSVAQMEKELISERTKDALAVKRELGIHGGRRPKYLRATLNHCIKLHSQGYSFNQIRKITGVSTSRAHQLVHEGLPKTYQRRGY